MYGAIAKLVMTLDDNNRSYDMNKIKRAYKYAYRLHDGQFRISGEPSIMHPIAVAEIVAPFAAGRLFRYCRYCGSLPSVALGME